MEDLTEGTRPEAKVMEAGGDGEGEGSEEVELCAGTEVKYPCGHCRPPGGEMT